MDEKIKEFISKYKVIVVMEFGSKMYGTNTPNSDIDYKGIYLPTKEQILLNEKIKTIKFSTGNNDSKNTKEDIDIDLIPLHVFVKKAMEGDTIAIDMIHCNPMNIVYTNGNIWKFIREYRYKFYTKNLTGPVQYAKKQAAKYGISFGRLGNVKNVIKNLESCDPDAKMETVWNNLYTGEYVKFVESNGNFFYEVCGKKLQNTNTIGHCLEVVKRFMKNYGKRSEEAEENKGIDWKAVSHALRYSYQIKELFETGDIKFPLKNKNYLLEVKQGKHSYKDIVAPELENLLDELKVLSENSHLPDSPDTVFWKGFIMQVHQSIINGNI